MYSSVLNTGLSEVPYQSDMKNWAELKIVAATLELMPLLLS